MALFDVAYDNGGDFDTLFQGMIDGLYNKEIKYLLGSTYPRNREEIKLHTPIENSCSRKKYAMDPHLHVSI